MSQEAKTSCDGCTHYLGGGMCAINVERECREGGGFELYGWNEKPHQSEVERLRQLLSIERHLHQETRRKLEKAEHDRKRYARRINFLNTRYEDLCRAYRAEIIKLSLLDDSGNRLQDRVVHQLVDDLALALVDAKRKGAPKTL